MVANTNTSQIGRGLIRLAFAGGSAALRFWAYNGAVGSADGDNNDNQIIIPWNGRIRYGFIRTTADPGAITLGIHIDRNLVALNTTGFTPSGAGVITTFRLQGAFTAGQELGISVDPANDPGASYLCIAIEYDSSIL